MYPRTAFTRSIGDSLTETIGVIAILWVKTTQNNIKCMNSYHIFGWGCNFENAGIEVRWRLGG
ncbi:phosphatase 2C 35 isoform X1 [Spatholobus suberectus]|nr:phosphatase 2C 35 isoform X1 [Spatholobus suberectus]